MDSLILLQQMLVLCAMMAIGFAAFKAKILNQGGYQNIASMIVKILNPFIIVSGVLSKKSDISGEAVWQNLILVLVLYGMLTAVSYLYVKIRRFPKREQRMYQLMLIFSNVGFMGIPLVRAMYGNEYVIFVAFYILGYNVLAYTYGIYLASGMSDRAVKFDIRKLLNPGTIASVAAILIFAFKIPVSAPVASLCEYMGNAAIPLSMMMIGVSLARLDLKKAFQGAENYIFLMVKMLAIPILAVLIVRQLPFNTRILGIFCITASMPVGGMVGMMAEEYGGNGEGEECNKAIAMTTILSAVTVPLVSLFF